jgi:hypothetical protein
VIVNYPLSPVEITKRQQMINIRQRSVNVARVELLTKLKENLEVHKVDFLEAIEGYKTKLILDLKAKAICVAALEPCQLKDLEPVPFNYPEDHTSEYIDMIEMLEMSVDETINLDSESFKAYIKNEWPWSSRVNTTNNFYKSFGGAAGSSSD